MKTILVTGDPVCDCHFYQGERKTADSSKSRGFRPSGRKRGGALLLNDLIKLVLAENKEFDVEFGLEVDLEKLPSHHHAYCLWQPQIANPQEKEPSKQRIIWRAVEPPLGYGQRDEAAGIAASLGTCRQHVLPDILVIDDSGLDFRKEAARDRWPFNSDATGAGCPRWVVLKLSGSIGQGALWQAITSHCRDNLIVIVSADQLRASDVRLSRGLSWEATIEDLRAELDGNHALRPLLLARHVIVTFRSDGAFWLDNSPAPLPQRRQPAMLVFEGTGAEGDWAASQGGGAVFGYLSCFTAAIVAELCQPTDPARPDFASALSTGLSASRELLRLGHGPVTLNKKDASGIEREVLNPSPGFPLEGIAGCIRQQRNPDRFVSTLLPAGPAASRRGKWMMLDEWQVKAREGKNPRPYHHAAFAAAILGPGALERFPVARFGELMTVDRQEIECLRILRRLIADYDRDASKDAKPLNLGVFGPPGAGKSFGVKEIAGAVLGEKVSFLTFNLSQFSNPADLVGALHQVRDKVLAGATPVVFWDEFDSEGYRWLQYLLAPMNDGVFLEGQITHPVGRCVFIFAGATSPSFETFGPPDPDNPDDPDHELLARLKGESRRRAYEQWNSFVLKKGPDFKSRLVSFLNVLGPNPRLRHELGDDGRRQWRPDPEDLCWPIRRAFFIRQKFKLNDSQRLDLDLGVLRALLEVTRFKSGSRSLEFLCNCLRDQAKNGTPRRSLVPGRHLLDMHVDAGEFWLICEHDLEFMRFGPELAPSLHEAYRVRIKGRPEKAHLDVPFDQLSEDMKAANLGQAFRIPEILLIAGLKLVKGATIPLDRLVRHRSAREKSLRRRLAEPSTLELLAEAEHNGWMVERMLRGWRYDPKRDDAKLLHDNLIPYNQISDAVQVFDRQTIIGAEAPHGKPHLEQFGYIDLVKTAGFRVVEMNSADLKHHPNPT